MKRKGMWVVRVLGKRWLRADDVLYWLGIWRDGMKRMEDRNKAAYDALPVGTDMKSDAVVNLAIVVERARGAVDVLDELRKHLTNMGDDWIWVKEKG